MKHNVQNFEMSRATAFWRALYGYWGAIILILLLTEADFIPIQIFKEASGFWAAARYLVLALAVLLLIRIVWITIDPRLITLTDEGIRFPATNLIFRTVPWSRIQSIEIGDAREFSFVHLIGANGRSKRIQVPLHLLGIVICERFINALKNYPVEVHCVGRSEDG